MSRKLHHDTLNMYLNVNARMQIHVITAHGVGDPEGSNDPAAPACQVVLSKERRCTGCGLFAVILARTIVIQWIDAWLLWVGAVVG